MEVCFSYSELSIAHVVTGQHHGLSALYVDLPIAKELVSLFEMAHFHPFHILTHEEVKSGRACAPSTYG